MWKVKIDTYGDARAVYEEVQGFPSILYDTEFISHGIIHRGMVISRRNVRECVVDRCEHICTELLRSCEQDTFLTLPQACDERTHETTFGLTIDSDARLWLKGIPAYIDGDTELIKAVDTFLTEKGIHTENDCCVL